MTAKPELNLDREWFLANHWQRKPLLIPGAVARFRPPVTAHQLTGLALESSCGLRTGSRHTFQLELGERRFRIDADVRWCRLTRTVGRGAGEVVPVFHTGIAFTRPLKVSPERGQRNSGEWLDPALRFGR